MKTLKLTFVVCFAALTLASFAQPVKRNILPSIYPQELSICVTIDQARTMPALVNAIYSQVDPGFLKYHSAGHYTFIVKVKNVRYYVSGSYAGFARFFGMKPVNQPNENRIDR